MQTDEWLAKEYSLPKELIELANKIISDIGQLGDAINKRIEAGETPPEKSYALWCFIEGALREYFPDFDVSKDPLYKKPPYLDK